MGACSINASTAKKTKQNKELSLEEEPGAAPSTNNSSHFGMQNEGIIFNLKELRVSGRLTQIGNI